MSHPSANLAMQALRVGKSLSTEVSVISGWAFQSQNENRGQEGKGLERNAPLHWNPSLPNQKALRGCRNVRKARQGFCVPGLLDGVVCVVDPPNCGLEPTLSLCIQCAVRLGELPHF